MYLLYHLCLPQNTSTQPNKFQYDPTLHAIAESMQPKNQITLQQYSLRVNAAERTVHAKGTGLHPHQILLYCMHVQYEHENNTYRRCMYHTAPVVYIYVAYITHISRHILLHCSLKKTLHPVQKTQMCMTKNHIRC
jgi:hypothetical protein